MRPLDWTALTLIIIGAINWGLVGFFRFDLIATLFGGVDSVLSRIIYALVGISGLWALTLYGRIDERHHTPGGEL
ncbi:MAG: DUF378 domain-containing protein [Defluviitaleaceae bacterium]|nr:DUF378 domain-containing protein [Defluviitaleaceae bacterium]MCL2836742.1 DUF378 domain-containing protein [Defluviitaleaceae bacterium]